MSVRRIRWGIIGTGRMALTFAEALRCVDDAQLVAVASRDADRAREFAQRTGAGHGFADTTQLLAADDVDVVYVATPNYRHKDDCISALRAGKPVLCEKPLATTAADAREIAAEARAVGLFCMEAVWTQFIPAVTEAERLLRDGAIGDPVMLTASFGLPTRFDPASNLFNLAAGGGALLDRGCYPISLALRLLGPVRAVGGSWSAASTGVDASATAAINFTSGAAALIGASLTGYLANDLILTGTEGRLVLHEPITCPSLLSIRHMQAGALDARPVGGLSAAARSLVRRSRLAVPMHLLRNRPRFIGYGANGFVHEIAEVHRCLHSGATESAIMPLELSINTLAVIDTVRATVLPE